MARLRQGDQDVLNLFQGNEVLAHLQIAAFKRFREGHGFFLTFIGGTDNDGSPLPPTSLWCAPGVPLSFTYDHYSEPIEINEVTVDYVYSAMSSPLGVVLSNGADPQRPFDYPGAP